MIFDMGQEFWNRKYGSRNVLIYHLTPIVNEIGLLLIGAGRLWHPWGRNTKKMLSGSGHKIEGKAEDMRKIGLAWAGNLAPFSEATFGSRAGSLLSSHAFDRYHSERSDKVDPFPKAAGLLASAAMHMLFMLRPQFEKVESLSWEERDKWVKPMDHVIEELMSSPLLKEISPVSEIMFERLIRHAAFLECEGLAYMQAHIEDEYAKDLPKKKRRRTDMTGDQIRKLADEIGMNFGTVKETMETEFSSWWKTSAAFAEKARVEFEKFLEAVPQRQAAKDALRIACEPGMTSNWTKDNYPSESDVNGCEQIVKTFIAIFTPPESTEVSRRLLEAIAASKA